MHVGDGRCKVKKGAVLAQWDPYNVPMLTEKVGTLVLQGHDPGRDRET
jgi:DNA-directed RNA polymerase subunit beta'